MKKTVIDGFSVCSAVNRPSFGHIEHFTRQVNFAHNFPPIGPAVSLFSNANHLKNDFLAHRNSVLGEIGLDNAQMFMIAPELAKYIGLSIEPGSVLDLSFFGRKVSFTLVFGGFCSYRHQIILDRSFFFQQMALPSIFVVGFIPFNQNSENKPIMLVDGLSANYREYMI